MATKYSTLSLDEELPREKSRKGFYVLVGFAVVALAGVATFTVTGHGKMESAVDAQFNMGLGSVEICQAGTDPKGFLAQLPRYDPVITPAAGRDAAFTNACYYAFRCCSTSQGACGAGSDQDFGGDCTTCLGQHTPRKAARQCVLYFQKKVEKAGGGGVVECANKQGDMTPDTLKRDPRCQRFVGQPAYTIDNLRAGLKPTFNPTKDNAALEAEFAKIKDCMPQGGDSAGFKNKFAKKCFEMVSWCDLTCPRDADNSIQHKYCKNCFTTSVPAIRKSNAALAQSR